MQLPFFPQARKSIHILSRTVKHANSDLTGRDCPASVRDSNGLGWARSNLDGLKFLDPYSSTPKPRINGLAYESKVCFKNKLFLLQTSQLKPIFSQIPIFNSQKTSQSKFICESIFFICEKVYIYESIFLGCKIAVEFVCRV